MVGLVAHLAGFNTQPPEGGWEEMILLGGNTSLFQHTAA